MYFPTLGCSVLRVADLISRHDYAEPLSGLKLWDMEIDHVSPVHMQGFFYRAKLLTNRLVAKTCANDIAEAIRCACGNQTDCKLKHFSVSEPPMLSGELRLGLGQLPIASRRCLYFALLMDMELNAAIDLSWAEVGQLRLAGQLTDAAEDVLDAIPRHIRHNGVFWENAGNQPSPLLELPVLCQTIFEMDYDTLREKFQTMVFVDPYLCAEELAQLFNAEQQD